MTNDTKVCPRCAETIKQAAVVCRYCGHHFAAPTPEMPTGSPWTTRDKVVLSGGLAAALIFAVILAGRDDESLENDPALPIDATIPERSLPVGADGIVSATPVSIDELVEAYDKNEAAAQAEYGGKWLVVTGTISGVDLDMMDEPVVHFEGDIMPSPSVRFNAAFQGQANGLSKGQNVSFLCSEVGEVLGSPTLDDCEVYYPEDESALQ